MSRINDLPQNVGDFGLDFNYSVWTPNTSVMLCNVPWGSEYRDIVKFASTEALDNYLMNNSGPTIAIQSMTYARVGMPVRINVPFNAAMRFNYLRVFNGMQPVSGDVPRAYYYFINDVRYVAPNTTELDIQLDVWQTFGNDVTFGNCYVERGHIGIANENQMWGNGRDYLTVPEGLDIGGEYDVKATFSHFLADSDNHGILILSTVSLEDSGGTVDAPVLKTAKPSFFEGLPNGAAVYYCESRSQFSLLMNALSYAPWVSQGIVSITAVPPIPSADLESTMVTVPNGSTVTTSIHKLNNFKVPSRKLSFTGDWRNTVPLGRYSRLKKFLTYPYTVIEATSYSGNPLVLKPESTHGASCDFVVNYHLAPPAARISYYPFRYNSGGTQEWVDETDPNIIIHDRAEFLDMTTGIFNLPTFALVNNSYVSFLAQNANGIAYQHTTADWSQQRALTGNELGFSQASANIGLSQDMMRSSNRAAYEQTALANQTAGMQALTGVIAGGVNGVSGGAAGMGAAALSGATAAANLAIGNNQRNESLGISTGLARQQNALQVSNQTFMRDTNREYADWAAKGDYANTIAGINARVQDAKMVQPTTSGQIGGDAFNLVVHRWGLDVKIKTIQNAALSTIGEFWLRYGYAINRFIQMPSDLLVMDKFTYWKLRETYVHSSTCPEMFKQTIRGIFEKGVTVWSSPTDIGTIDIADNEPKDGVTL